MSRTAQELSLAIDRSGKTLREIGLESGLKGNCISMMRNGAMPIPVSRAPALAIAAGLEPSTFVRQGLGEYDPAMLRLIDEHLASRALA